jgi:serine/threonine protein kinase
MNAVAAPEERSADASLVNGHFRFLSCLGAGGMGSVYMARYLGGCVVAVKLVKHMPDNENSRELEDRFDRECRILMGLRHPSIVTAFTHGRIRGTAQRFLVMEYVEGVTLAQHRRALGRPLTPQEATQLLMPIADALAYCHANRIFHRDLSPKNLLVVEGPGGARHGKLVDFGASWRDEDEKLTQGIIFGNIDFQPLERFQRETQALDPTRVGFEVDLFGLAAIAYYLTGGTGEKGALLDIHQKVGAEPLTVEGHPEWSDLLASAIHRERGTTYPDMAAFQRVLRRFHPAPHERDRVGDHAFWLGSVVPDEPTLSAAPIAERESVHERLQLTRPSLSDRVQLLPARTFRLAVLLLVGAAFVAGLLLGG